MDAPAGTQITRLRFVNAYLVDEDDGLTLIDTTLRGGAKVILARAQQLGKPIKRIALTHGHGDHIGSVDELVEQLGELEVLISARDARLLAKDLSLDPDEPQTKIRGSVPGARTQPTRTLSPGERVGSLEVIAAPGHTPGHIAFLDTRDRVLYCGDAYTTFGGIETTARTSVRFPLASMVTWHKPIEIETAKALRALDPAALAPGHGRTVENPGPAMDAAIRRAS